MSPWARARLLPKERPMKRDVFCMPADCARFAFANTPWAFFEINRSSGRMRVMVWVRMAPVVLCETALNDTSSGNAQGR